MSSPARSMRARLAPAATWRGRARMACALIALLLLAPNLVLGDDLVDESEQLVEEMKRLGKTYELFVYEGEGHGFLQTGNLQHFYATLGRFLDWYLL